MQSTHLSPLRKLAEPSLRSRGRDMREPQRPKIATASEASLIPRSGRQKQ